MRAARIENGVVTALWEVPALTIYGSSVQLVEAGPDVQMGASYADGAFTNPEPPLLDVKAERYRQIGRERDAACFADVTVHGRPWQADARSQQMLASAILLTQAGVYTPTVWRDADNNDMTITSLVQLVAIAGAMAAQTQAAYTTSWVRKAALEAATTVQDVEAV
jgi:hypothetical protein